MSDKIKIFSRTLLVANVADCMCNKFNKENMFCFQNVVKAAEEAVIHHKWDPDLKWDPDIKVS
jgi:hypothetical protein